MQLSDPITKLAGIGAKRAELFAKLSIHTVYDLLAFFPRTYEDRTKLTDIAHLQVDEPACFRAIVCSSPTTAHIRKGLDITKVMVADHSAKLKLTFFNQPYRADSLKYGEEYYFYGAVSGDFIGYQMNTPVVERIDSPGVLTRRIMPIYPLTAGITNTVIAKAVRQALDSCLSEMPEILPEQVRKENGLISVQEAYRTVHDPETIEDLERARKRLVFEEFFIFAAGLRLLRERRTVLNKPAYENTDLRGFAEKLPFSLTGAQKRAISEILSDFRRDTPMNRLVQGDVGSGKTMVAAAAAYCVALNGEQTALMAPTEILAEQHYASLSKLFENTPVRCGLLTGSMKASEKKAVRAKAESGEINLLIGTHALISEATQFSSLGLVIADEQHRFGVGQRAALSAKGTAPHLLVMSATPIPRTLALIMYGDLDISVIDELPPGRQGVDTYLVDETMRKRINAFIRKQVAEGHQVYIVCPAVEESEIESLKSAEVWAETLQSTVFSDLRVALLHGQMKGAEKDAIMSAFKDKEYDILVATTVIEVGVDVPNATLMVIENADRFGLSQLHQLRGRVGRGGAKSYCVLFSSATDGDTLARLKALCKTNDGFKIAEEDLRLRGPGDFFGTRQSGLPVFKVANLSLDPSILKRAQDAANRFLADTDSDSPAIQALLGRIKLLFPPESNIYN